MLIILITFQVNQSWEALDAKLVADWALGVVGAIDTRDVKIFGVTMLVVKLFPVWCEVSAVATPWSVELDEPCLVGSNLQRVQIQNIFIEFILAQIWHFIASFGCFSFFWFIEIFDDSACCFF
mgnify:CR=1 FL=1